MINRQHARTRTPNPHPGYREINLDPPEEKSSVGEKYHSGPRPRPRKSRTGVPRRAVLLFSGAGLSLLLCKIMITVDWSFLGGVFLVGLRSSSPSVEVTVTADDHTRSLEQQEQEPRAFPQGWRDFTYDDIRAHFDCRRRSKDDDKPLPSLADWELLRDTFARVVDDHTPWRDDPVPPTLGYSLAPGVPAPPPYYARASPGKGRGLFAARDIAEGELVHDGTHSDVVFPDAVAWRRFVFSLPPALSCDCTDWHWMQRLEEDGPYFMLAGINVSSLMNSGGAEFGPSRRPNALPESSTSGRFYATRDIAEGSEILTDYDSYYTNWEEVGL